MATIQELIDRGEAVLGETTFKLTRSYGLLFKPLGKAWRKSHSKVHWFSLRPDGTFDWRTPCYDGWEVYVEPVEMEDRWLWATDTGSVSSVMYSELPVNKRFHIKLEWSRTSFPKEDTSD